MQEAGESGGVDSATVARLARSLFAPDPGAVPQLAELLAAAPMAVSAAEAAEAEERLLLANRNSKTLHLVVMLDQDQPVNVPETQETN